jgi:hypothetical protein
MRRLSSNQEASVYPVIGFFICIAVAGFLVLIFGEVLYPFFQLGNSYDDSVAPAVSLPRMYAMSLLYYIWPKGVLLVILFGLVFWLLMTYQKKRYKESL